MKTTRIASGSSGWRTGKTLVGPSGFGVLGSSVPSAGISGPGYAYTSLSLPADANKEICGRITSWPSVGTLYAYDDTSFVYTPPGSGYAYTSFNWQLYVDSVAVGSPVTVTLSVGGMAATVGAAVAAGATAQIVATPTDQIVDAGIGNAIAAGSAAAVTNLPLPILTVTDYINIAEYVYARLANLGLTRL